MKKSFVAVALVIGERPSGSGNGSNRQKFCGINRQGSGRGWQQDLSGCSDRQGRN